MADAYEQIKSRKKPVRRHVDLCLDSAVADAYDLAVARVRDAESAFSSGNGSRKAVNEAKAEEERAHLALLAVSQRFEFQNLSRAAYSDLVEAHPPTEEQRAEAESFGKDLLGRPVRESPDFDIDSFAPALVAACIVEPPLTETEVEEMFNDPAWTTEELITLYNAANQTNGTSRVVDLGKGSGETLS